MKPLPALSGVKCVRSLGSFRCDQYLRGTKPPRPVSSHNALHSSAAALMSVWMGLWDNQWLIELDSFWRDVCFSSALKAQQSWNPELCSLLYEKNVTAALGSPAAARFFEVRAFLWPSSVSSCMNSRLALCSIIITLPASYSISALCVADFFPPRFWDSAATPVPRRIEFLLKCWNQLKIFLKNSVKTIGLVILRVDKILHARQEKNSLETKVFLRILPTVCSVDCSEMTRTPSSTTPYIRPFSKFPTLEPDAHKNRQLQISAAYELSLSITADEWLRHCEAQVHQSAASPVVLASPLYWFCFHCLRDPLLMAYDHKS